MVNLEEGAAVTAKIIDLGLAKLSPVRCSGGTLASSALGWKRQRRASMGIIRILCDTLWAFKP
jgi:hypothetical protein